MVANSDFSPDMPMPVQQCMHRLQQMGAWYQLSRNDPATSCQDAARKRWRLGHTGIPLCDELKSYLGEYDRVGGVGMFLAHCRGDRDLDLGKVAATLGAIGEVRRLPIGIATQLGASYGVVNPFLIPDEIIQIFDSELRMAMGIPGTVMTNAGDHTWAVEFYAAEVGDLITNAHWADIRLASLEGSDRARVQVQADVPIGILTGNPCDSGLDLCNAILNYIRRLMGRESLGDVSMPKIILVSRPQIGISMEMQQRERPLRVALLESVDELCGMGAKLIAHPAHTTHYFGDELAERARRHGAKFVSMAVATDEYVRASGITQLALLGTRFVTDVASVFSVYRDAFKGIVVHRPSPAGWQKIHDLGYEVQQKGATPLVFNWMRDLLRDEVPQECKHVVLAMTEFAPVARQLRNRGRHGKILIEPLDVYGRAVAREYVQRLASHDVNPIGGPPTEATSLDLRHS